MAKNRIAQKKKASAVPASQPKITQKRSGARTVSHVHTGQKHAASGDHSG